MKESDLQVNETNYSGSPLALCLLIAVCLVVSRFPFETGSHHTSQTNLKLAVLLPVPPHERHAVPCQATHPS